MMSKVKLHVYEVTKGLAAQLSSALLGRHIPGVWHTGIVCFGTEYCFGNAGIMQMHPGATIIGAPDEVIDLGETNLPHELFEEYLFAIGGDQFRPEKYHLFDHNCNNFSNDVAQFLTGKSVPSYILDLPRDVANTPLGAMLKTFMDGMSSPVGGTGYTPINSNRQAVIGTPSRPHDLIQSNRGDISRPETTSNPTESKSDTQITFTYEIEDCCLNFRRLFDNDSSNVEIITNSIINERRNDGDIDKCVNSLFEMSDTLERKKETEFLASFLDILSIILLRFGLELFKTKNGANLLIRLVQLCSTCVFKAEILPSFLKLAANFYSDKKHRDFLMHGDKSADDEVNKGFLAGCVECLVSKEVSEEAIDAALSMAYNMSHIKMDEETEIELSSALLHWINSTDKSSTLGKRCIATIRNIMKSNHQVRELAEMTTDLSKLGL